MAKARDKAKARVYGKKVRPQEDLDEAFASLSLGIAAPQNSQNSK